MLLRLLALTKDRQASHLLLILIDLILNAIATGTEAMI